MKTYRIYVTHTVEYVAEKEFATRKEASAWAENQWETVDLDQSNDWDDRLLDGNMVIREDAT